MRRVLLLATFFLTPGDGVAVRVDECTDTALLLEDRGPPSPSAG